MNELVVPYVWWMGFLMMFFLPMLTMRLIAEERRTGTLETLFTYPLTDLQIVLGKFLAALCVALFMIFFGYVWVAGLSTKVTVEWNLVGMGLVGLILYASALISFGLWASSLTSSQMVAAVLTYGGLMMMWLVQVLGDEIQFLIDKLGPLSVMEHLENMVRGNITTHDFVYYFAWIGLFVFLTCRVLESRKWST
jgi:ABC-2 type transport system permease protein